MGNCFTTTDTQKFVQSKGTFRDLKNIYELDPKLLGSGSYGQVYRATSKKDITQRVAIKMINKNKLSQDDLLSLRNEVAIMQQVDHPHIVKYYETYEEKKTIYLVMELCTGGELLAHIVIKNKLMSESQIRTIMKKLFLALQHIHAQDIIHRDIKPENICYGADNEVKFIDFGFAMIQHKKRDENDIAGTPYYIAPEVLSGNYGKECDLWSLGVVLYQMFTGQLPFDGETQQEIFYKIVQGKYKAPKHISADANDLLRKMINIDQDSRISAAEALKHKWFLGEVEKNLDIPPEDLEQIHKEVLQNIKQFKGESMLKRATVNIMVKHLEAQQIEALKREFLQIDTDQSGFIEIGELKMLLQKSGSEQTERKLNAIIENLDFAHNKKINYSEFLGASIDVKKHLKKDRLNSIFAQFDTDNKGFITITDLKNAFSKLGKELTQDELDEIMEKHDSTKKGQISRKDFQRMLIGDATLEV